MAPRIQPALNLLIATIVITCGIFTAGAQVAPAARKGKLTAPVSIPLFFSGKKLGEATLPPGTPVLALGAQGDKTLIRTSSGEAWVASASVALETLAAPNQQKPENQTQPQPTAAPSATSAPAGTPMPKVETPDTQPQGPSTEPVNVMMFDYQRAVINKGSFVWLAVPFEKEKTDSKSKPKAMAPVNVSKAAQANGAVPINLPIRCILANCLKYVDPAFPLASEEVGQLMSKTGEIQWNSFDAVWRAGNNAGMECKTSDWNLERIKSTLEENSPLVALGKKACAIIAGYQKDELLIWDPKKHVKIGKMPEGCTKMKLVELEKYLGVDPTMMPPVSIAAKSTSDEDFGKKNPLPEMGKPKDIKRLRITTANPIEGWEVYSAHALPAIVNLCVKSDRAFVARTGGRLFIVKPKGFKSERQILVQSAKGEGEETSMVVLIDRITKESVEKKQKEMEIYSVKTN